MPGAAAVGTLFQPSVIRATSEPFAMAEPRATLDDDLRARALAAHDVPASTYPGAGDERALAALAEFLEDTAIRALPVEGRDALRRARAGNGDCASALSSYGEQLSPALRDLGKASREAIVDELLERATALKYADAEMSTSKPAMDAIERSSKRLKLTAKEMSDVGASLASGEGKGALLGFARALGLDESSVRVNDPLDACVLLERCVLAQERFVTAFLSDNGKLAAKNPPKLDEVPSGVGLNGDPEVERAVAVARLLHVNDLRRLQSSVDTFLVAMQEYTADPKTDSRIGRVGR